MILIMKALREAMQRLNSRFDFGRKTGGRKESPGPVKRPRKRRKGR
jgi:hypothetical protein